MAALKWDETGKKTYETGVDRCVLFPYGNGNYEKGVAWSGLISVSENPSGAENTKLWADNINYLNIQSAEELSGSIECYTYPDEWKLCDGSKAITPGVEISQQNRSKFALCYRTLIGNDTQGNDHGYKIHIMYGCSATPSEKSYSSTSDSPEAITFSYEYNTTPVPVQDHKPTPTITIDSRVVSKDNLKKIEDKLYGSDSGEPTLLLPDEIVTLIS